MSLSIQNKVVKEHFVQKMETIVKNYAFSKGYSWNTTFVYQ